MKHVLFILLACLLTGCQLSVSEPELFFSNAGQKMSVRWSGASGNKNDWIGLYRLGAGNRSYLAYAYTRNGEGHGASSGNSQITLPVGLHQVPNGKYELRLYLNNGYQAQGKSNPFSLGDGSMRFETNLDSAIVLSATPNSSPVLRTSSWTVTASGYSHRAGDWVGVFAQNQEHHIPHHAIADRWFNDQYNLYSACEGPLGPAEVRLYRPDDNGTFQLLATSETFTIDMSDGEDIDNVSSVTTDRPSYRANDVVTATWSKTTHGLVKEIAVFAFEEPEVGCYKTKVQARANGTYSSSGSVKIDLKNGNFPDGKYELRILQSGKWIAVSTPFSVRNDIPTIDIEVVSVE